MSKSSILMLPSTQGSFNLTGEKVRADGWYGFSDGLHTVAIYLNNFRGRLVFEASIATDPQDGDWFPVEMSGAPYMQFPRDVMNPTGDSGDTGTIGMNITGSFIWLRARVDRSYIVPAPIDDLGIAAYGYVDRILLNN